MWNKKPKLSENFKKLRKISSDSPQPDIIQEAAAVIQRGGVVTYPTWCLYGLGADALNVSALHRVFRIKQRPLSKPLLILVAGLNELPKWVIRIPQSAERIMNRFWPGGVTLVFHAGAALPSELTAGTGKIGIRLPKHPVAAALVHHLGTPITGTSANIAGQNAKSESPNVNSSIADRVDLILDAGKLRQGPGSTVVDVTTDPPLVLREGIVPAADIYSIL